MKSLNAITSELNKKGKKDPPPSDSETDSEMDSEAESYAERYPYTD